MTTERDDGVLIGGREPAIIRIVDYDPAWPVRYEGYARTITTVLGRTLHRLEHIGSTAVPGLAAKPIVDILALVDDSANEASYLPQLEAAGYQLRVREPAFEEHRMLRTTTRDMHLHVFSRGAREAARQLAFRDWLRTHPDDRLRYEARKRQLATHAWPDMNAYADAKTGVIEAILALALHAPGSAHDGY